MTKTDITIVGAGLIGLCTALCLQKLGGTIHIVENHLPDFSNALSTRPISLSYGSYRILNALGVWAALSEHACPILSVHVSEQGRFGVTQFSAKEQRVPALGYVVPFGQLLKTLYYHVASHSLIHFHSIHAIEKIECGSHGAKITVNTINGDHVLHADLLIAADGTHSVCRDLLRIACEEKNDGDIACIFHLTLSQEHTHTAYERFTDYGVLAVLPLHDKTQAQCVWTLSKRLQNKIADWTPDAVTAFFKSVFEGRLEINSVQKIVTLALQTLIAKTQIIESALLLGNAAHTIYPVAAQGFNLGLHDVSVLYDVLRDAKNNQQNLGQLSVLKKYEMTAKSHQDNILKITYELMALFDFPMMGALRGLGLLATDVIQPIKNTLAKRTMGVAGKLPRLLRRRS